MHAFLATLAAVVPILVAGAQNTWIVDALNRPGTHFTDLPPAVAAASPGDVLFVRYDGGPYNSFSTSKGLTICSEAGSPSLRTDANGPVTVTNLPAGQQFTLRGFDVVPRNITGPNIQISGCSGRVVLHSLWVDLAFPNISIQSSASVLFQESQAFGGYPALSAQNSYLEFVSSALAGAPARDVTSRASSPAVSLKQCRAVFSASHLTGGLGGNLLPPAPALELVDCRVDAGATAFAGLTTVVGALRAGAPGFSGIGSSPAVSGRNSKLRLDPALPVVPTGSAPPTAGVVATNAQFPGLYADTNSHSHSFFVLRARDIPGAAQVLVLGVPADPRPVLGIAGNLWIDQASLFVSFEVPYQTPNPNLPFGTLFASQIASLSPATGVELSNVAMLVLR
jgi:hypothetical protein